MKVLKLIIFILVFVNSVCGIDESELKVNYLVDIINEATNEADSYHVPKNNGLIYTSVTNKTILDFGEFDFIVVGGGSSGSVLSSRLSDTHNWKILLLEAGGENDELTNIPGVFQLTGLSSRNWGFLTSPQKKGCYGRIGLQCPYIRGKILGGSGSINGLVYARGIRGDYDRWAERGNTGWSFEEVLPIFKKIENFESENADYDYRGFAGPLNVAYARPKLQSLLDLFYQANEELKLRYLDDYNAMFEIGVSEIQHNIESGRRTSGAVSYVQRTRNRPNFNVSLNSLVTKILIKKSTKTAYGVLFVKNGRIYRATATKEVIVSGGAASTPQLLMLSGIGPKKELNRLKIPVIEDLPVGRFMKDSIAYISVYYRTNHVEKPISLKRQIRDYLNGHGYLTDASNYQGVTFLNTRSVENRTNIPDIEITFTTPGPDSKGIPTFEHYVKELDDYHNKLNFSTDMSFNVFLLHPKSSGLLTLKSKNPDDFPIIDPKIFDDKRDLDTLYRGISFVEAIVRTKALRKLRPTMIPLNSCSNKQRDGVGSKNYWYCAMKKVAFPAYHLSSTAKMGPSDDPLSVVDPELKVYGIKKLRVADCSVMPTTVSGHTNAVAFLIGEKAAQFLEKEYL